VSRGFLVSKLCLNANVQSQFLGHNKLTYILRVGLDSDAFSAVSESATTSDPRVSSEFVESVASNSEWVTDGELKEDWYP
jgi:hypothetical protein